MNAISYLANREDMVMLLARIYAGFPVEDLIARHHLIVVGGQALAFWHYEYLLEESSELELSAAFSDDLDFFGNKSAVDYLQARLGVEFQRPATFSSTVNLGITTVPTLCFPEGVIVEVIHSVGGLKNAEIASGIDLIGMGGFEVPVLTSSRH